MFTHIILSQCALTFGSQTLTAACPGVGICRLTAAGQNHQGVRWTVVDPQYTTLEHSPLSDKHPLLPARDLSLGRTILTAIF